jgi:hypothetical protein
LKPLRCSAPTNANKLKLLLALLCGVCAFGKTPKISYIQVAPGDFALHGRLASQRIVVTGNLPDGSALDVTPLAQFKSADSKVAAVSKTGVVTPVKDGETFIQISAAGKKQRLHVTVSGAEETAAAFVNQVAPLLGTLGCNSTQCHGGQRGKGGLKLSLFGGDPDADFDALTRASGGRRINRAEPRQSLLFLKATGGMEHAGGKKAAPGTPEYQILLNWLEGGAPWAADKEPRIASLQIYPDQRLVPKAAKQRLLVTAVFTDGSQRDVTAEAALHSSDPKVASVAAGAVTAEGVGDAAVVATWLRKAAVFRVTVPQTAPVPFPTLEANNEIDKLVYAKLKTMGIPPSGLSTDAEFLRRAYLDTIGLLPTAAEARAFLADRDPQKRARLIDRLLERDEFNDFWALKWGDILRIKSEFPVRLWPKAVAVYYQWLHESLARNKPYDEFARELLTATGSNFRVGPSNFVRAVPTKDARTLGETAALVFMGARMGCARCHSHPQESWTLDDDLALGAFFAKVNFKATLEWKEEIVYSDFKQNLRDPRTRKVVAPRLPDGKTVEAGPEEDPRGRFAQWLTSPDNPWFTANITNRIWFWLMGKGIVNDPDDLRSTNPPTNPELLAYLGQELAAHQYDLKHIYRLILNSRTYQLSSEPNQWNAADTTHFSHYAVKRLTAEQMLDAVSQFTETSEKFRSIIPEPFSNWPADYKATQISDGNTECPFLDQFGRATRDTPYEAERDNDLTMRQVLYFLNSEQFEGKIANSPRIKRLLQPGKSDAEIVDEIYLTALSRFPNAAERKRVTDYLAAKKSARAQAVQDVAWAVLNGKEFIFNH